jgi:hypothetical protein
MIQHTVQQPTGNAFPEAEADKILYCKLSLQMTNYKVRYIQLMKNLYGLKQAGAIFNQLMNKFLLQFGFEKAEFDSCGYVIDQPFFFT